MSEEETKLTEETKQEIGDASLQRMSIIYKMVREYFRALNNGTLNSMEFTAVGIDTCLAGLQLISRSNDMDMLDVDQRISIMKAIQATINSVIEKVYLNPEVASKMVAQAAMEATQRAGLDKKNKKADK